MYETFSFLNLGLLTIISKNQILFGKQNSRNETL